MNIFFLDSDIKKCAQYHVDKHVVKQRLELAQLGCTAHHILGDIPAEKIPYKPTHKNHPSAIWVRESLFNYNWIVNLGLELCNEMRYRFGTPYQKTEEVLLWLKENPIQVEDCFITKQKLAVGDNPIPFSNYDDYWNYAVDNYRKYYNDTKQHLFKWTNRKKPEWIR